MSKINRLPLIPGYERIPDRDHPEWIQIDGILTLGNVFQIEHKITKPLLNRANLYNRSHNKLHRYNETKPKKDLIIIYSLRDPEGNVHVGSTNYTLTDHLRINLSLFAYGDENIYYFTNDPVGIVGKVLEYLYQPTDNMIDQRIEFHRKALGSLCESLYRQQLQSIKEQLASYNVKKETHTIFVHEDIKRGKRVVSSLKDYDKVNEEDLLEYLTDHHPLIKKLEKPVYFRKIFERKVRVICDTELLMEMDIDVTKFDSIKNGYNKCLAVLRPDLIEYPQLIRRSLFISVNKDLIKKYLVDDISYPDDLIGFVYEIRPSGYNGKYIGYTTMKDTKKMLIQLFTKAESHKKKDKKIHQLLGEFPCFDLLVKILRKKVDDEIDLEKQKENYIKKYNSVNDGYNDKDDLVPTKFYLFNKKKLIT